MAGREYWNAWDRGASGLEVVASELVVATPAGADIPEFAPLAALLQRAHRAFDVDMAFVSEWCGEPVARTSAEGDALHALHGQRVLERRAPPGMASRFGALPVVAGNGLAHGMLCFRRPRRQVADAQTEDALRGVARLIANWFEAAGSA